MANRKKPETGPILDSKSDADDRGVNLAMEPHQFNKIIRLIKHGDISRVIQLQAATAEHMQRLRKSRDLKKAVPGPAPEASHQVNIQDFVRWAERLTKRARRAVGQLVAIDATLHARTGK